nr:MAG TPA: MgrB protein [Bacteriophage sp.]
MTDNGGLFFLPICESVKIFTHKYTLKFDNK